MKPRMESPNWIYYKFFKNKLPIEITKPLKLTLNVFLGLKSRVFSFWYTLKKGCAKACSAVKRTAGSTTSSLDICKTKQWVTQRTRFLPQKCCLSLHSYVQMNMSSYQVFHSVRPVIPLRGAELIAALHNHPQHQHLFPMPERRRTGQ